MLLAAFACALSLALWLIVTLVAWRRGGARIWHAPAWTAAVFTGPAVATARCDVAFHGLLRGMTESGNPSMATIAAWGYEALRPLAPVLVFAAVLQFFTTVLLYRLQRAQERDGRGGASAVVLLAVLVAAMIAMLSLHQNAVTLVNGAFMHQTARWSGSLQELGDVVRRNELWTTGFSAFAAVLAVAIAVVSMAMRREHPPSPRAARAMFALAALAMFVWIAGAVLVDRSARVLLHVANTGQLLP